MTTTQGLLFEPPVIEEIKKPTIKNADKYIRYYEELCEIESPMRTSAQIKLTAFENTVVAWLDNHREIRNPDLCAYCGGDGTLVPVGAKDKNTWLHMKCCRPWMIGRRKKAVEALREMGITATKGVEGDWDGDE